MIHVHKSANPPPELESKGYKDDAVKKQLLHDQHDKCYLCERKVGTDYEVEHLKSQTHFPQLINEWTNLFIGCNYCNDRKKEHYDDILNPSEIPVGQVISQKYDAKNEMFCFEPVGETSNATARDKTIELLKVLFNGKNPKMLNLMESRFRKEILLTYNAFQKLLNEYLDHDGEDDSFQVIKDALNPQSECLGLKYWLLESNPQLKEKLISACNYEL
jgi:uncharacterized protein (TIGR02646 family)